MVVFETRFSDVSHEYSVALTERTGQSRVSDINQITIAPPLPKKNISLQLPTPIGSARGLPDGDALDLSITAVTHRDSHVSDTPRDSRDVIRI